MATLAAKIQTFPNFLICNSNYLGGLLGVSGKFPPAYIGGVFSGQAVGGIFASVTSVVMIILGAKPVNQAFFCFLVAVVFLGGSLVFYIISTKSEFYQYYLAEKSSSNDAETNTEKNHDHQIILNCSFKYKCCLIIFLNFL